MISRNGWRRDGSNSCTQSGSNNCALLHTVPVKYKLVIYCNFRVTFSIQHTVLNPLIKTTNDANEAFMSQCHVSRFLPWSAAKEELLAVCLSQAMPLT